MSMCNKIFRIPSSAISKSSRGVRTDVSAKETAIPLSRVKTDAKKELNSSVRAVLFWEASDAVDLMGGLSGRVYDVK